MTDSARLPYWRLSGFYLFYFASLGALVPYWGLYLKHLGFDSTQIGELLAVLMATKIVAPNLWGWIADHTGKRMWVVRLGSLLSILCFVGVFFGQSYAWMMAVMLAFSFFWNATLPQFEANTLSHLGRDTHRYSNIRLWGSIGFILSVVLLGALLEEYGAGILPFGVLLVYVAVWMMSLATPGVAGMGRTVGHASLGAVLKRPEVLGLLLVCFLLQASHGPYYAFYSIYMEAHGYSRSTIGQLWALGVLSEIVVFMFMHKLLGRYSARSLMLLALLLTALRWGIIGTSVENHLVMILAQTLHAASFGLYHAVAIHLIHEYFPGRLQGRGQALYSSLSFGAGGAFGALYSGYLWDGVGAGAAYATAAGLCVLAMLITLKSLPRH